MSTRVNFDDLRRLHQRAMVGGPRSNAFALFAAEMYRQFSDIYMVAKALMDDRARRNMEIQAATFTLPDADQVGAALEAGQAADFSVGPTSVGHRPAEAGPTGHIFVGLDFQPIAQGMPDDDRLVFLLFAQENADDTPILMGFRDAGFWFGVDGMTISLSYTVIGWADMPEVVRG